MGMARIPKRAAPRRVATVLTFRKLVARAPSENRGLTNTPAPSTSGAHPSASTGRPAR